MSGATLLSLTLLTAASFARAQEPTPYYSKDPLAFKVVPYDAIPYQVMTDHDDPRGFQVGYNQCGPATENQTSMCQTMFVNHIDDFCLWGPATPNTTIADSEGEEVAWCSKKGHGTRLIPEGAITSIQYIKTPSYIQISGTLNQAMLNIGGTYGGELDSGAQDGEGNPMGGLVYSNAFAGSNGDNGTYLQSQHWSFFIGNNAFCGKVCDMAAPNAQQLCNNIYDRLGCDYNAPANVAAGTFEVCQGDDMSPPVGTYVVSGVTSVYTQPAESVDIDFNNFPYTPTAAPSSSCTPFASTAIFTDVVGVTGASVPPSPTAAPTPTGGAAGASSKTPAAAGGAAATNAAGGNAAGANSGSSGTGSPAAGAAKPSTTGQSAGVAVGISGSFVAAVAACIAVLAL